MSNLFFAQDGQLKTPSLDCGILDGVTRDIVIQLAREQRMVVEEGQYTLHDLQCADECFLTNTSMEIMPVASVDDHPIGSGKPGAITRQLRSLFGQMRSRFLE